MNHECEIMPFLSKRALMYYTNVLKGNVLGYLIPSIMNAHEKYYLVLYHSHARLHVHTWMQLLSSMIA